MPQKGEASHGPNLASMCTRPDLALNSHRNTMEDIPAAFAAIGADYQSHSRAARTIAGEYFRAETVLSGLLKDVGL